MKKERFQMRKEGKKRNFNKITFNDTYFRNHMELLNHSLEDKKSKQDIYHPYIYEYLEDVKNIKINTPQKWKNSYIYFYSSHTGIFKNIILKNEAKTNESKKWKLNTPQKNEKEK